MTQQSIAARIREQADEHPDREVYWHIAPDGAERAYTWSELDRRSSQLAGALRDRGLGSGDRLGMGLRNTPQLVLSSLAAWKLGAVPVPMRWDLPDWEFRRLTQVVDAPVQLGEADMGWIEATAERPVPDLPDALSPHANGICSSGSTGLPKVIVSDRPGTYDPVYSVPFLAAWGVDVPRPQHVIVLGPMYHINGFHGLFTLLDGDLLFVMEKFDAARVVDVIERHRISFFNCTPTMLKRMADLPDIERRDLSSLVWFSQGAAPMPPYLAHRWIELIGPEKVIMAYGMTEGLGLTALRGDEYLEHEGSVGRPIRSTQVRILDAEGKPLPPGEIGDIYMRSEDIGGSTYLGEVPQLATAADGFRSVRDMGYLDEDGYLYLVDRRVDMIITGGANVFPAEVENALMDHPKVADVVVIGLRDEEWGRRVHAVIEPADAADPPHFEEVRVYAKGRLAPYKVPKTIEIVDAIPRSAATKVSRGALVEARGG